MLNQVKHMEILSSAKKCCKCLSVGYKEKRINDCVLLRYALRLSEYFGF